jgi:DNA repair protein RadA/Sms
MAKAGKRYICSNCGAESPTWAGRCHVCGEWNTLEEEVISEFNAKKSSAHKLKVEAITNVVSKEEPRITVGYGELDRVLGGGFVKGAVMLFAGEPGIGKSTLLMQVCASVAGNNRSVLYVSGEESAHQVGLRARRLGVATDSLNLATSSITDDIAASVASGDYRLVIVDSIQTLQCNGVTTSPGSVSQITSSTHLLISAAKQSGTTLIIVGHVTKEGAIAGPKVLEHIVDAVFQLEGDRYGGFKVLRSIKNRYGSTNEAALFEMKDFGLAPVDNPSKALLAERQDVDGSIVCTTMEGSRPLLVEVQALVNKSAFGYPKRTASGIELNRLNVLTAMLDRRTKLNLSDKDIYINIVGGIKINEPAADLAVCMAIGSAAKGLKLQENTVVFGEVGLSGEVRHVPFIERRLEEAKKLGFTLAIAPKSNTKDKLIHSVKDVRTALNTFLKD